MTYEFRVNTETKVVEVKDEFVSPRTGEVIYQWTALTEYLPGQYLHALKAVLDWCRDDQ